MKLRDYDLSNSDVGCVCYNMDNSMVRNSIFFHLLLFFILFYFLFFLFFFYVPAPIMGEQKTKN